MPLFPDDADGAVLAQLAAQGADLPQPMLLEFTVAAPDEQTAQAIEIALTRDGYPARVVYDEGEPDEEGVVDPDDEEFGPSWTVYVALKMVPAYEEILRLQAEFERVAAPLGGGVDGWGTLVEGDAGAA